MAEYDNTNTGVLFKNDRKADPKHADWNGTVNVDGQEFYLNAWIKEKKADGSKFFSLSVKPKDGASKPKPAAPKRVMADLDDEIPF
jgi:hypothetical protein